MNRFGRPCMLVAPLLLGGCVSIIEETGDVAVAAARLPFRVAHAAVDAATGKDESHAHGKAQASPDS